MKRKRGNRIISWKKFWIFSVKVYVVIMALSLLSHIGKWEEFTWKKPIMGLLITAMIMFLVLVKTWLDIKEGKHKIKK